MNATCDDNILQSYQLTNSRLVTLLAVYKCFKTEGVSFPTVWNAACWGQRTANIRFPETLIYDVATVQVPWESLGFQESFHNVIAHVLCSSMFTSNSLFLLFTVFCWHHHFSELPQHQQFHHVTGLPPQPRSGWEPAPSAEQFPIKKPIPSHMKSCSQHQMAQEHTGDATSPCTCIASETGNHIYPKKVASTTDRTCRNQRNQWFLPSLATGILKTHSSGTKFYFQLKFNAALLCWPGTSNAIYALLPLGKKA